MSTSSDIAKAKMLEALEASLGIVTTACKSAGVGRTTYYDWLNSDPDFRKAVESLSEVTLDFAESQLHKQISSGNTSATIFYLKTKGRSRGYIETRDITNNGGSFANPYEQLSVEQLEKLADLHNTDEDEEHTS